MHVYTYIKLPSLRRFRRPGDKDSTPAEFAPFTKIAQPTSRVIPTTDAAADRLPTMFYQPQGVIPTTDAAADRPPTMFYQPQGRPFIPDPKYVNVAPPEVLLNPTLAPSEILLNPDEKRHHMELTDAEYKELFLGREQKNALLHQIISEA